MVIAPTVLNRRLLAALSAAAITATLFAPVPALAAVNHTTLVGTAPSNLSPDIIDGTVFAIHDAGSKVIAAGSFTTVQNRDSDVDITRNYVLAFDKATGQVDSGFAPVVADEVRAVVAGPTPGTVYIAGKFNTVNGVTRRKVALLNVSDGSLVTSFAGPAFNGLVNDIALVGGRLLVGGIFTTAGNPNPRGGLASLNASTGAVDSYLTTTLTENHNYNGTGAQAGVGAEKLAVSPDGSQLVVIGNFRKADGVLHDQVVKLDLGTSAATVANWHTHRYEPACARNAFDSYMRDVAYSPDGEYFVIVTTGAKFSNTLCDTAARWESDASGSNLQPTWADYSGGDTLLSVAISEEAVYVGGHLRWMNNSLGTDNAQAGAVGRASIAALDPVNGLPLSWNPGRHPRGYGVAEMLVTSDGLWLGHDQSWMGNFQYRRERIAFLPLAGGAAVHPTTEATLPGNVYLAGPNPTNVLYRVNAGGAAVAATDGGPAWESDTSGSPSTLHSSGSNVASYTGVGSVDSTVPAGTPTALFSTERWDPPAAPQMQWDFPVASGTEVKVRLYLANRCTCTDNVGERRFDVSVEGAVVLNDFDIVAAVGHNRGTMREFTVTSDGTIDVDFGHVTENPLVNAIEIVKTGTAAGANDLVAREYDGDDTVGADSTVGNPDATTWSTTRGAFWVGGTLFYATGSSLYRRSFDGTTLGTVAAVDPYHDAYWDTVETDSNPPGQTYAGSTVNFYPEIANLTGLFYDAGRIYYTLSGQNGLFWRWFTPDSGVVGADKFTVSGASGFAVTGGLFVSGDKLYLVNASTGNLSVVDWVDGAPSGTATLVSGPGVDGVDWRAKSVFVGP